MSNHHQQKSTVQSDMVTRQVQHRVPPIRQRLQYRASSKDTLTVATTISCRQAAKILILTYKTLS